MKIKDYKCKCGCDEFFFGEKGNQCGIYCSYCGKWFKWADKDEQNLMMHSPVLDMIRADIEKSCCVVTNDYDRGRNYGLFIAMQIIDKYVNTPPANGWSK